MTTFAVTSQNFRTITPHAGRTRRFLIYEAGPDRAPELVDKLDLPKAQALHHWGNTDGHPIFRVDVVIAGSCGRNFVNKLGARGVDVVPTPETDPESAIRQYFAGTLPVSEVHDHRHHHDH
jgi:predicted Fe-Mo cluster-binding NifX family protein